MHVLCSLLCIFVVHRMRRRKVMVFAIVVDMEGSNRFVMRLDCMYYCGHRKPKGCVNTGCSFD